MNHRPLYYLIGCLLATALIPAYGCELIYPIDRKKNAGAGGADVCDPASCDAMDNECLDFSCNADNTACDDGVAVVGNSSCCDPAACDAMDQECLDFSCNANNITCDDGVAVAAGMNCLTTTDNICNAAGQCVSACDPAACDAMDEECLDFSCNTDNTACNAGVAVTEGMNCLLTESNICNDNGVCVPLGCTNTFMDGEETDVDCGGTMCDGCNNTEVCLIDSDCRSNNCNAGTCEPCSEFGDQCAGVAGTFCDFADADASEQVCKPKFADGGVCDVGAYGNDQCTNDHCVDGVCCDTVCDGTDCESCLGAATGGIDGTCAPVTGGTDPDGDCTQNISSNSVNGCESNSCSGTSAACAPATGVCRAAVAGGCDVAESCGAGLGCPANVVEVVNTPCRMAAGVCDAPEVCDGASNTCPTDDKLTTQCRAAVGFCNLVEVCDGVNDDCPPDTNFAVGTTSCRTPAGDCDAEEFCTGASNTCPTDLKLGGAETCRPSFGACDPAEVCGGGDNCPANVLAIAGVVCRPKNGDCDIADVCVGVTPTCPADDFAAAGASGDPVCTNGALCDNTSTSCPTTCTEDTDCETTHFCPVGNTMCTAKSGDTDPCTGANECTSGVCIANVCVGD